MVNEDPRSLCFLKSAMCASPVNYGKIHTDFSFLRWESETLLEASDS